MTTRTYRQRRNGRLGWLYAWLNPARELRDVRALLAVEQMRHQEARDALAMAKHNVEKLRIEVELLDATAAQLVENRALAFADLAKADDAHDELTRRLERHDAWIRRAKPFLHTLEIDDPELDWLIYMAPDVGEGEG